jgi:hypothetical protein
MLRKKYIIGILLAIFMVFAVVSVVDAATYTVNNSTDVDNISKMISGKIPIKDDKYIKNGDIVKFNAGNYNNIKLVVNKRITLTTTKNGKNKVIFIGNKKETNGTVLEINSNKVNINGFKIKNYALGIYAKTYNSSFRNIIIYNDKKSYSDDGMTIVGNKNRIFNNKFNMKNIFVSGKYNRIYSNKLNFGVIETTGYKNTIKKNSLTEAAIYAHGNKNLIISNRAYKYSDIVIGGGKYNKIYYNKVSQVYNIGITVYSPKNIIYKNSVSKSQNGIGIGDKGNILKGNKISNCKNGIIYTNKNIFIKGNIFKNNKRNVLYSNNLPGPG